MEVRTNLNAGLQLSAFQFSAFALVAASAREWTWIRSYWCAFVGTEPESDRRASSHAEAASGSASL